MLNLAQGTGVGEFVNLLDNAAKYSPPDTGITLRAARQSYGGSGRVIAVMQPHRYTRLAGLREEFATCFGSGD